MSDVDTIQLRIPILCKRDSKIIRDLFNWMDDDMDINAGTILDGVETIEEVGEKIFDKIVAVASGEKTKSELVGMGDEEFAPWTLGPTL